MDYREHVKGLPEKAVSLTVQQSAKNLFTEAFSASHIDRATETGGSFTKALVKDLIELNTSFSMRRRTYKLHRQLGLSAFQAMRHSSPSEGLLVASLVIPNDQTI